MDSKAIWYILLQTLILYGLGAFIGIKMSQISNKKYAELARLKLRPKMGYQLRGIS